VSAVDAADPEAAYYQAVEEYFVSRRGEPLVLSNADWHLVRKWREAGTPLRVVLRGIRDALDAHALGWSRNRPVRSLAYCAREVGAARERWERALATGTDGALDAASALRGFAADLERATGLGPLASAQAAALAAALRERAGGGRLSELTAWLQAREESLLEAIREDLGPERREEVEAAVERGLLAYRDRLPARVVEQLRRESRARRLLESHGLPRLSLFHLEGVERENG
jgi:hypothetical protein